MQNVQETLPDVGHFKFEVYRPGRNGRRQASRFTLRCDAIGLHDHDILLLSVVGPETSVKALTAGLRSSGKDQRRIDYSAHVGNVNGVSLAKCPDGYHVFRSKLAYGLWHVLCLAKREGFLPVLTEAALWQHLQGDQFTTPLLREWTPWLYRTMKNREIMVELSQSGCQAGLLLADNDTLDTLVSEGIRQGHLAISPLRPVLPRTACSSCACPHPCLGEAAWLLTPCPPSFLPTPEESASPHCRASD